MRSGTPVASERASLASQSSSGSSSSQPRSETRQRLADAIGDGVLRGQRAELEIEAGHHWAVAGIGRSDGPVYCAPASYDAVG